MKKTITRREYNRLLAGVPWYGLEAVLCSECMPNEPVRGQVIVDLSCTCAGTQRNPIPFSEMWGLT